MPEQVEASERYASLASRGLLATCNVISGEVLYSMADVTAIRTMQAALDGLWCLPLTEWAEARALEVVVLLADRGKHRAAKIGDLQIAAVAEQYKATVLRYDHDFDDIVGITGQPTEWIVPRGAGHGNRQGRSRPSTPPTRPPPRRSAHCPLAGRGRMAPW